MYHGWICTKCNEYASSGKATQENGFVCRDCYNMEQYENGVEEFFLCPVCGRADSPNNWIGGLPRKYCFSCSHWAEMKEQYDVGKKVVVDGKCYHVGDETESPSRMRGFGGAKFNIKKFTGEKIVTTNLWHNGEIPDLWRPAMPDNAEFIEY